MQAIIKSDNATWTSEFSILVSAVPTIDISLTNILFSAIDGDTNTVEIIMNNTGSGVLSFNIDAAPVESVSWLTHQPHSGTILPAGETSIWFFCNSFGLTDGIYHATVSITHNAAGSPLEIPVEFVVPEPGGIIFIVFCLLYTCRKKCS